MSKKQKLEPNTNHSVPVKKGLTQKGGSGAKKGVFVGNKQKIHIHIVKDGTHIKIAGTPYPFDETSKTSIAGALKILEAKAAATAPGYKECHEWLTKKS